MSSLDGSNGFVSETVAVPPSSIGPSLVMSAVGGTLSACHPNVSVAVCSVSVAWTSTVPEPWSVGV